MNCRYIDATAERAAHMHPHAHTFPTPSSSTHCISIYPDPHRTLHFDGSQHYHAHGARCAGGRKLANSASDAHSELAPSRLAGNHSRVRAGFLGRSMSPSLNESESEWEPRPPRGSRGASHAVRDRTLHRPRGLQTRRVVLRTRIRIRILR